MTYEELELRYERLLNKVKSMRKAYWEHRNYKGSLAKKRMEAYGHEIDRMIKEELKARESKEGHLF